ncbi:MAG: 4-hydroxythreonine-4-phosphate dehydrogenase PdxA [Candidatus Aminicenantes bacterium RBG_19FT_COMBO_58_17]|jgi:4-hydroxythreonine-4-phosphate dehydrogenase|nr:MAG: 4-hydroxythreonine-4-phosphate dehydrogenase PdxA [Candidatus Aminicenantes bacterium RBG_19FT_COMBO_58_17]HCS48419.1 4-hydroxythreonine-4-phosphate dehydrogenase PdxA [Candidatus Aminicenantes bacterium]
MTLRRIGITLGDPGGISPEIVLKALAGDYELPEADYVLFGSAPVLRAEEKALGIHFDFDSVKSKISASPGNLAFHEIPSSLRTIKKGVPSAKNGLDSFHSFKAALAEARKGNLQAIVTAPISKSSWALAGVRWKGHTDYLSHFYAGAIMAFWSKKLKVALFSHHVSLKNALKKVNRESLLDFFLSLDRSLKRVRPGGFELLVAGLNPHAGEDGLLGRDETEEISPAIKEARRQGIKISGPYPPDVVFRNALGQADKIVIALYHDQGLIPFKLAAFDSGVNVSLGLPFIRTSPDHGTAFDIAGKNRANPRSLIEAIKLAAALARSI